METFVDKSEIDIHLIELQQLIPLQKIRITDFSQRFLQPVF